MKGIDEEFKEFVNSNWDSFGVNEKKICQILGFKKKGNQPLKRKC